MSTEKLFEGKPVLAFDSESSRRSFLRWAGLVGVGSAFAVGGGLSMASSASAAPAASSTGDLGILNYALTLEYLEATFYAMGVSAGILSGREAALIAPIAVHEAGHVAAITAAVTQAGGTPVAKPSIHFPSGTFTSKDTFLKTASTFEELGVVAYHGQVPLVKSAAVLGAAASIAGVESRHAAIIATLIGGQPFPHPIEAHEPMSYVLPKVKPYIS
ncbi:MAG: twin-arginine translocation pathway signal protein [Pseudonocardiales bacterium]|nr:MAG: twin-arginine translocation pathway signal protein [Pseudonocardiales bacterium]